MGRRVYGYLMPTGRDGGAAGLDGNGGSGRGSHFRGGSAGTDGRGLRGGTGGGWGSGRGDGIL